LLHIEVSIGRTPTKISEGMKKMCMSAVTVGGLDRAAQATKLVNRQMGCNANVQTVRKVLKAASLEARAKTKKLLLR
jgi:hypothetical protein